MSGTGSRAHSRPRHSTRSPRRRAIFRCEVSNTHAHACSNWLLFVRGFVKRLKLSNGNFSGPVGPTELTESQLFRCDICQELPCRMTACVFLCVGFSNDGIQKLSRLRSILQLICTCGALYVRSHWRRELARMLGFPSSVVSRSYSQPPAQESFSRVSALKAHERCSDRHRRLLDMQSSGLSSVAKLFGSQGLQVAHQCLQASRFVLLRSRRRRRHSLELVGLPSAMPSPYVVGIVLFLVLGSLWLSQRTYTTLLALRIPFVCVEAAARRHSGSRATSSPPTQC